MKVVPGFIYNQVPIDCNASLDKELSVSKINLLKCVQNHKYSWLCSKVKNQRVRDREPSCIPLKKMLHWLNSIQKRTKCQKMLRKTLPFSSALHHIARNFKLKWNKDKTVSIVSIIRKLSNQQLHMYLHKEY